MVVCNLKWFRVYQIEESLSQAKISACKSKEVQDSAENKVEFKRSLIPQDSPRYLLLRTSCWRAEVVTAFVKMQLG